VPDQEASRGGADRESRERDLVQLVYVSTAAPDLTPGDVAAIAEISRLHNEAAGLTGLLVHQGRYFYGVLEGARRRVFGRMEVIITDRRHSSLRILREDPIEERRFANWSFGSLPAAAPSPYWAGSQENFIRSLARRLK
jgi:hypothetical protein